MKKENPKIKPFPPSVDLSLDNIKIYIKAMYFGLLHSHILGYRISTLWGLVINNNEEHPFLEIIKFFYYILEIFIHLRRNRRRYMSLSLDVYLALSVCFSLSLSLSIYIYIYIYCHPHTDCFVVSQLVSVAWHAGRFELGSKPA